jgi:hypothetical protein
MSAVGYSLLTMSNAEILAHNSGIGSHARFVRGMGDERVWLRINWVLSVNACSGHQSAQLMLYLIR